jgi:hypothetical protein
MVLCGRMNAGKLIPSCESSLQPAMKTRMSKMMSICLDIFNIASPYKYCSSRKGEFVDEQYYGGIHPLMG